MYIFKNKKHVQILVLVKVILKGYTYAGVHMYTPCIYILIFSSFFLGGGSVKNDMSYMIILSNKLSRYMKKELDEYSRRNQTRGIEYQANPSPRGRGKMAPE